IQGMLSGIDNARAAVPANRHSAPAPSGSPPATLELPGEAPGGLAGAATSLPAMADLPEARYLDEVPPPPEPPHDDEEFPPPDDEPGPSSGPPTTVNPITNT
ncbi:MAG TPA: hypothetical protein PLI79_03005, partial [Mycobacterium sp.]|nr:hypothetical protein [Mycobacterium sp.]